MENPSKGMQYLSTEDDKTLLKETRAETNGEAVSIY